MTVTPPLFGLGILVLATGFGTVYSGHYLARGDAATLGNRSVLP